MTARGRLHVTAPAHHAVAWGTFKGMAPAYRPDLADGWLDIRIVEATALARSRLIGAVLTGTLGRSRVYRTWHARSVSIQAVDGQPIWLATDGEVATAESGFVHGKHPHELMVYRRQGPSHAGQADVPDDDLRVWPRPLPQAAARDPS